MSDVDSYLDLRHATQSRWDAHQLELAQKVVVPGMGMITLNEHIGASVEKISDFLVSTVALNLISTVMTLDPQQQWRDIEQQVLRLLGRVTVENGDLHGGTIGHSFVRIDRLCWAPCCGRSRTLSSRS